MDQDAHGGISELSVGLNVLGVDVMNGIVGVLKSLSGSFVSGSKFVTQYVWWNKFRFTTIIRLICFYHLHNAI